MTTVSDPIMILVKSCCLMLCVSASTTLRAQRVFETPYSRLNTLSVFAEYSNDSSRIMLGDAVNRKIGAIGLGYQRRLVHAPLIDIGYTAELRPAMIESDPTEADLFSSTSPTVSSYQSAPVAVTKCVAATIPYSITASNGVVFAGENRFTCGRRQVFVQGFAPVGFTFNLLTRHAIQPAFSSRAGYIFATQQVPVPLAGSFNFAFDLGAGLEIYRSQRRSARLEYVYQHYSNKKTGDINPGVDSGFVKLSYAFGK